MDRLFARLVDQSAVPESMLGAALLAVHQKSLTDSWSSRFEWLSKGFGIPMSGTRQAQAMRQLVELRNAIVHGSMALTDRQMADIRKMIELKRSLLSTLDVHCVGRAVRLGEQTLRRTMQTSVDFVTELDRLALRSYPRIEV